jgi:uncharacterized protein YcnI
VTPQRVDPGTDVRLVFSVPNTSAVAITRVAIGLPPDFQLEEAETQGGWTTEARQRTVAWEGSRIVQGQFADFGLLVRVPSTEERAVFSVLASQANGQTITYQTSLTVASEPAPRDHGARTLATAALIVASIAALLALGGSFLALWLWLRPRPPDPF